MVKAKSHPDYILAGTLIILLIFGVLMISSVSASLSLEKFGGTYYFLNHQLLFGLLPGLILAFVFFNLNLDTIKKWAPLALLINIILLAMVFLPKIGLSFGGATRWLYFGGNVTLQPSEFLKLTTVLYLASLLSSRAQRGQKIIKEKRFTAPGYDFSQTFAAFLIITGLISALLIFQPDVSTLGIIIAAGFIIYFATGTPISHSLFMLLTGIAAFFALIMMAPYRMKRWLVFLDPEIDPLGIGYQLKQSLIAVGSGGLFGLGLGMSRQKFGFLPQSMTDSIFAVFSEEAGFAGAAILISLFLILLWQGFKIAKASQDYFLKLTALGITSWITLQAFVNIGTMIGILPIAGIPLPFISYGGTHLVMELAGMGILLNISKNI